LFISTSVPWRMGNYSNWAIVQTAFGND
jgi:hypothetical protein